MAQRLEAYTPMWWVRKLEAELDSRRPELVRNDNYYEGKHDRLPFQSVKWREAFGSMLGGLSDNWCQTVVDAPVERLKVEGFRISGYKGEEPSDAVEADKEAWRIWQANQLDAESQIAFTEAFIGGECYGLAWTNPDDESTPLMTIEHPTQMICGYRDGFRRRPAAALKKWLSDDGLVFATLYLPDDVYKWQSARRVKDLTAGQRIQWVPRELPDETWPLDNPLGQVPVVAFVNRRRLLGPGRSEIKGVIPLQNAVNTLLMNMMVNGEFTSMPQRWATGVDIPSDAETGEPIQKFVAMVNRMWVANPALDEDGNVIGPEPKFGEFAQSNPDVFVKPIEMIVQHIASQTRTPPHYLNPGADRLSGESIKAAETGLVAKVLRQQLHFGESLEQFIRLGFAVLDDPRGRATNSETIWGDPESRTEGEHVDAATKLKGLGLPLRSILEYLDRSPTEIDRIIEERKRELAESPPLAVISPTPPVP